MTVNDFLNVNIPNWFQKNKEVAKHLNDKVEKFQVRENTIIIHALNGFPLEANKSTGRVIRPWVGYFI
jgi:hypothetical protein